MVAKNYSDLTPLFYLHPTRLCSSTVGSSPPRRTAIFVYVVHHVSMLHPSTVPGRLAISYVAFPYIFCPLVVATRLLSVSIDYHLIWLHAPPISTSVSVQTGLCPALLFSFLFLCMGFYLLFSNLTSSSPWLFELFSTSVPSLLIMTTFDSHMSYLGEHIGRRLVF